MDLRIRFQGKEYWLIAVGGEPLNGAIATEAAYKAGEENYAHLYEDGIVRRYRQEIGVLADIEILGPANPLTPAEQIESLYGTLFNRWAGEEEQEG